MINALKASVKVAAAVVAAVAVDAVAVNHLLQSR